MKGTFYIFIPIFCDFFYVIDSFYGKIEKLNTKTVEQNLNH